MFLAFFAEFAAQIATAIAAFLGAFIVLSPVFMILFLSESERRWTLATDTSGRCDTNGFVIAETSAWDEWTRTRDIERARFRSMLTWSDLGEEIGDEQPAQPARARTMDQASVAHALAALIDASRVEFSDNPVAQDRYSDELVKFLRRSKRASQTTQPDTLAHTAITVASARE